MAFLNASLFRRFLHPVIPDLIRDPASSVRQQRADRQVNWLRYGSETPDQVRGDGEAAAENRTLQSNVQRVRMKIEHKERS